MWDSALLDSKPEIREAGYIALQACVAALGPADRLEHRNILLNDALTAVASPTSTGHAVHGALLACCILAKTSNGDHSAIQSMWPFVLKVKERDYQVVRAAMDFVTIAAEHSSDAFLLQWLQPTMNWLCEAMKRDRDQVPGRYTPFLVIPKTILLAYSKVF